LTGTFSAGLAATGDDIILGSEEGTLYCVGKLNGQVRWKRTLDVPVKGALTVRGRYVFVAGKAGELLAVDNATGDVVPLDTGAGGASRGPVAATDRIFFATGNLLAAFAPRAEGYGLAWTFHAEGPIRAGPTVVGNAVYVGDEKGNFYRIEAND
ncbi:MAG: PQQ-binding-like beta-propeller repeat protein, partial [Planctomycetota bacterium]